MRINENDLMKRFKETITVFKEEYDNMSNSKLQSIQDKLLSLRIYMRKIE